MRILYSLLSVLLLAACGRADPVPQDSLAWANAYYIQNPIASQSSTAGGWLFRGARDYRGELRVGFLISDPMPGGKRQRRAILRLACPSRSEMIWQILPSENKFVITVWTQDNKFKDSVSC